MRDSILTQRQDDHGLAERLWTWEWVLVTMLTNMLASIISWYMLVSASIFINILTYTYQDIWKKKYDLYAYQTQNMLLLGIANANKYMW
jgi:hypothetical protein